MYYSKLSNIINDINTVLLPLLCFGCKVRLSRGEQTLCTFCRNQLPLTDYTFNEENAVDRTFYGRIDVKKAGAFLYYSELGIVKNLIHYLKYKNQPKIGAFLGNWYGQLLKDQGLGSSIDLVIPVPLHPKKLRKRGYNQVALFGERIAFHLEAKYSDSVLVKTANVKTQTQRNRIFRWQAVKELYILKDAQQVKGKNILLVDDVITTGATLEACVKALEKADYSTICIATMAVVP